MKVLLATPLLPLLSVFFFGGCASTKYKALEKLGYHKRDILIDRVKDARDAQNTAKEQFRDALEQFTSVVNVPGGELEAMYAKLKRSYERSEKKASEVSSRIDKVDDVSKALFKEWTRELKDYRSASLRQNSERQLRNTQENYKELIHAMRKAEDRMQPVLRAFKDQVLWLKHNLNAQAVAALEGELTVVRSNISHLIRDMEHSIREADRFIEGME